MESTPSPIADSSLKRLVSEPMSRLSYWKVAQLLLLSASIAAIVLYPRLPLKTLALYPSPQAVWVSYTDRIFGGATNITHEHNDADWYCRFAPSDTFGLCGHGLMFYSEPAKAKVLLDKAEAIRAVPVGQTFDFTHFDGIEVTLKYQGPAERLRFSITNYEPSSERENDDHQHRFMDSYAHKSELNTPIYIAFEEFRVADWWMTRYHMYRSKAVPRFDNIRAFYVELIDQPSGSEHHVEVSSINVVGRWITREQLYGAIILLWALLLVGEMLSRLLVAIKRQQSIQHANTIADSYQKALTTQTNLDTDGLLRRKALEPIVEQAFLHAGLPHAAVLLLRVSGSTSGISSDGPSGSSSDSSLGTDEASSLKTAIAKCLIENTRHSDLLGHWGEHEYLVIAQLSTIKNGVAFSDKLLKVLIAALAQANEEATTVHIGFTLSQPREGLRNVLERTEQALALATPQPSHASRGL